MFVPVKPINDIANGIFLRNFDKFFSPDTYRYFSKLNYIAPSCVIA